jgi:hypothetical protein
MSKQFLKYCIFIYLFVPLNCLSQIRGNVTYVKIDSVIYQADHEIPPYPFESELDSLLKVKTDYEDALIERIKNNPGVLIDIFNTMPGLYVELENGQEINLWTYRELIISEIPEGFGCTIHFLVEWNGTISGIKIGMCSSQIPEGFDIAKYLLRIKAHPAKVDDIILKGPFPMGWTFGGRI